MTADTTSQVSPKGESKILSKVFSYPVVNNLLESAKGYYSTAKNSNGYVKMGLETVESNLNQGVQWIAPKVEPVLHTQIYRQIDQVGFNTLGSLEQAVSTTSASISHQVQATKKTFGEVKSQAIQAAEIGLSSLEKKLEPVDEYLKDSVLGTPLHYTLDLTEKVCDKFLEKTPNGEVSGETLSKQGAKEGPLKRTRKLSKRLQAQAFSKMKDLSTEGMDSMKHPVSLILSASNHLDSGIKTTNQFLSEKLTKGVEVSHLYLREQQLKIRENSTFKGLTAKVEFATQEAMKSVAYAVDLLSKQVQLSFPNKFRSPPFISKAPEGKTEVED